MIFDDMNHNKIKVKQWIVNPIKVLLKEIGFKLAGPKMLDIPFILFSKPPEGMNFKYA